MALVSSRAGSPKWIPDPSNILPLLPEYCLCFFRAGETDCILCRISKVSFVRLHCSLFSNCPQTESEDSLRVVDEAEGEKGQGNSGKTQVKQEEGWLDDFVKGLDEFVGGLYANRLVGGGLVIGRGIFPAGVVVEAGVLVL